MITLFCLTEDFHLIKTQVDVEEEENLPWWATFLLQKKGESCSSSSLATFESNFEKFIDYLKCCVAYCSVVTMRSPEAREMLVRLLLAECLIPEKTGEIMEDLAEHAIDELITVGMLHAPNRFDPYYLQVPCEYKELYLFEVDEQDFISKASNLLVWASIDDNGKNIPPNFRSLQIESLFVVTSNGIDRIGLSFSGLSQAYMETICRLQSLRVLDLDGMIEYLPSEIGELVHLRYLGLRCSYIQKLPQTIRNLQKLQTLDISFCSLKLLPMDVLNLPHLRHLRAHRTIRVPKEIGTLVNLYTLEGVSTQGGIASEFGMLTQLRKFGVEVSEDNGSELFSAIMKMEYLVSLSLEADEDSLFPEMEEFSPPPLLQEISISGRLVEIPNWLASMDNLTTLSFQFSRLLESPTLVLQFLPKLKDLALWDAFDVKLIGKEFCEAGGFPKLETLKIASRSLVEWTEIVEGAFPSLRSLQFYHCTELRFLPEGLQNISTLQELILFHSYNDIGRRLNGQENYKIKHITKVSIYELPSYCLT